MCPVRRRSMTHLGNACAMKTVNGNIETVGGRDCQWAFLFPSCSSIMLSAYQHWLPYILDKGMGVAEAAVSRRVIIQLCEMQILSSFPTPQCLRPGSRRYNISYSKCDRVQQTLRDRLGTGNLVHGTEECHACR